LESLIDVQGKTGILNRINKLTPDSKPLWGKMTVSKMMAHCTVGLRTASGEVKLKRNFLGILFGGIAKKSMMSDKPIKQGLPTDKNFVIKEDRNFDEEKTALIGYVKKFDPKILTTGLHPFFGTMTIQEWDKLMAKHLDHHLRQFGV
jgi:hypothetical protein